MSTPASYSKVVFPTPVGMNRRMSATPCSGWCVPHTRGDEPVSEELVARIMECSPHPWG